MMQLLALELEPQAKDHEQPLKLEEARADSPLKTPEEMQPSQHLDLHPATPISES